MATSTISSPPERAARLVSVVVPMYDEEAVVDALYDRVRSTLDGRNFELVVVNDASRDATGVLLDALADADPRVKVVHLARSFGHQAALTAGLAHASGEAIVMMDGDLQDPPEVIPEMLTRWQAGYDVVSGVREQRLGESWFKLASANWFYRLFRRITRLSLRPNAADFRLLDRSVVDALLAMPERNRFLRGMTAWVGFRHGAVHYRRAARPAGISKYTVSRMVRFSVDAITAFSWRPLELATAIGAVLCAGAIITGVIAAVTSAGLTMLLAVSLLLGGVQLLALGVLGEYIGRIYDEVLRRPLYVVQSVRNLDRAVGLKAPRTDALREPEQDLTA